MEIGKSGSSSPHSPVLGDFLVVGPKKDMLIRSGIGHFECIVTKQATPGPRRSQAPQAKVRQHRTRGSASAGG